MKTGKLDNKTYKYLTKTQSLRNQSDYEAIDDITAEIAKEKINQAREFIDVTKELL